MLEHETDPQYGQRGSPKMNKIQRFRDETAHVDKENDTLEILQEEGTSKYDYILSNSVLESYAELKAWTSNTTESLSSENKVWKQFSYLKIILKRYMITSIRV